eukprot:433422_1
MMANEEFPLTNIEDANVVAKLCKRILDNPSDCKYQSICVEKLYTKLNDYKNVLGLLNELGFHETSDHKRLIFDMNQSNLEKLQYLHSSLLIFQTGGYLVHPDDAGLITNVFSNILTYPNNIKYQSIRCSMLNTKLKDYKRALILFDEVGFIKSSDNKRFIFVMNEENINKLGFFHMAILMQKETTDKFLTIIQTEPDQDTNYEFESSNRDKMAKLNQLIIQFDTIEEQTKNQSGYLLELFEQHKHIRRETNCFLEECLCLKDIMNVLNRYRSYYEKTNNSEEICVYKHVYEMIGNKYNSIDLLDG